MGKVKFKNFNFLNERKGGGKKGNKKQDKDRKMR